MNGQEIGMKIRELRQTYGINKRRLAQELGISYSAVCAYEYGKRIPSDEVKIRIANFFGTTVQKLFYSNENHET